MAKKIAESKSVAFFDSAAVAEPGFYTVEESEQELDTPAGKFKVSIHTPTTRVYVDDRADVASEDRKEGFFDVPLSSGGDE